MKFQVQQPMRDYTSNAKEPDPADLARSPSTFSFSRQTGPLSEATANQTPSRQSPDQARRRDADTWHPKATNDKIYRIMIF